MQTPKPPSMWRNMSGYFAEALSSRAYRLLMWPGAGLALVPRAAWGTRAPDDLLSFPMTATPTTLSRVGFEAEGEALRGEPHLTGVVPQWAAAHHPPVYHLPGCPLPVPEDRLRCLLVYLKTSALQVVHGWLFGQRQSAALQRMHVLWGSCSNAASADWHRRTRAGGHLWLHQRAPCAPLRGGPAGNEGAVEGVERIGNPTPFFATSPWPPAGAPRNQAEHGAARLWLVLDRLRRMG